MPFLSYFRNPRTRCQQEALRPLGLTKLSTAAALIFVDHCIPTFAQDAMIRATKVEFSTRDFQTSHSPFLSQPVRLASTLLTFARDYMASNDSLFEIDGDEDEFEF